MERARRQAAGPMRVILEASKSKRRVVEPEVADSTDPQRRAQPQPRPAAPEPAVIAGRSSAPAAAPPVQATPAPPAAGSASPAGDTASAVVDNGSAITTEITLTADDLQRRGNSVATPALSKVARAPVVAPLPAAAATLPVLLEVKPKLVSMVDPVVTPALLDGVSREGGVTAELTLRADGTVASVSVLPPASRQLVRAVVTALEQWRFEPLPGERQHRVQLVFND